MTYKIDVDQFYDEVKDCVYKGEHYQVRNNGAIIRLTPDGKKPRQKDGKWTFGETITNGYACFCGERVHRIVATAFLGEAPTKQHVVDHIDTNRQNNRPENLRWLTKMENILLNTITRQKLEFRCGSVEKFLENPSQLKCYEHEDANFSWMRAVSPDEARRTLESWQKLMSQPRPLKRKTSEPISDWIFGQTIRTQTIESVHPLAETMVSSQTQEHIQEDVLNIVEHSSIPKNTFLKELIRVCDKNKWTYQRYYKTTKWNCDILITTESTKFAFSVYSSKQKSEKAIETIMSDGVNAFGFLIKQIRKDIYNNFSRTLGVSQGENGMCVSVQEKEMTICEFVEAIVYGRLVVEESYMATAMNVIFTPYTCYSCKCRHYIYMVHSLINAEGEIVDYNHEFVGQFDYSQFSQTVIEHVKRFVIEHPAKHIKMDEIKPSYSKTMDEEYMLFGCPYCDGIVGGWYLQEIETDIMCSEENDFEVIPLQEPVEIKNRHWKMVQ